MEAQEQEREREREKGCVDGLRRRGKGGKLGFFIVMGGTRIEERRGE